MAVIREFFCPAHGDFEAFDPVCPHGCTVKSERVFLTPPAYHNGKTRFTDRMVEGAMREHGLTNLKSARTGEAMKPSNPAADRAAEFGRQVKQRYPSMWGQMPKQGGVEAALAAHHAPATNAIAQAKELLGPPKIAKIFHPEDRKAAA